MVAQSHSKKTFAPDASSMHRSDPVLVAIPEHGLFKGMFLHPRSVHCAIRVVHQVTKTAFHHLCSRTPEHGRHRAALLSFRMIQA